MAKSRTSRSKAPARRPAARTTADPEPILRRIAAALERLAPRAPEPPDLTAADAFVWQPSGRQLAPVPRVNRVEMSLLKGIDRVRDIAARRTPSASPRACPPTTRCCGARAAWASPRWSRRCMPRSMPTAREGAGRRLLKLVEIHREDIESLPRADGAAARRRRYRFIVFCDDLSFDEDDTSATSRSRRCWKAASKDGRTTWCSTPPPTAAT